MSEPYKEFVIDLKQVSIYQDKSLILSDVNLRIKQGEFVYLVGKTGSGKSSLLKTIYADLSLKKGQGNVVGFDLGKVKTKEVPQLRRKLGIVFQDFQLLMDRSINENLEFVLKATGWKKKEEMKFRIDDCLKKVNLHTKGFKMPHELSGGEQQRVVIARALLNEPVLILADEPTGNLDPDTSDEIMQLLISLCKELNTGVLMATHDYTILEKFPSRILTCVNGGIIDEENFDFG